MLEENGTVSAVIHGNDGLTDIGDTIPLRVQRIRIERENPVIWVSKPKIEDDFFILSVMTVYWVSFCCFWLCCCLLVDLSCALESCALKF